MSSRALRRHSRSLVRARAPPNGPKQPSDGPDGGPGNGNGRGHAFGQNENHSAGTNGDSHGNNKHQDNPQSPDNDPPPDGGLDPNPDAGIPPGTDNDGGGHDNPPSTGDHESGSGGGGNPGENNGGTPNSEPNPPDDVNGISSSATSISVPQTSSPSRGAPSKTSDSTTLSPSDPPVNADTSHTTTNVPSVPSVSANIVSSSDSSALLPAPSPPSPNPSPSSSQVTSGAALSHHDNGGAIAGGVVGAVLFLAIAFGAWIVYKRRRRHRLAPSAAYLSNPSAYPFARGFGAVANRSEKSNPLGSNHGGAGTGAAGKANFRSLNSDSGTYLEKDSQMEQYRDERSVPPSVPLPLPPQSEILYSTRPPGTPPPVVSTPGSMPGTPTSPNGRRIPFGTGTFHFPPRPPQSQPLFTPQPQ